MPFTQSHLAGFAVNTAKAAVFANPKVRKASAAFYAGVAGTLGTSLSDGNVSSGELLASLGAGLVASALVYGFRND